MDTAESLLKGGDNGPVVVPGAPEKSLLIKAVTYKDLQLKMPPTGKLSDDEIQRLTAWVKMGAPDPRKAVGPTAQRMTGIDFEEARRFWAFRKIQNAAPPTVKQTGWVRSPIDHFVLAQLEGKGIKPAPPADKHYVAATSQFRPDWVAAHAARDRSLSEGHHPFRSRTRGRPASGFSTLRRTLGAPLVGFSALR